MTYSFNKFIMVIGLILSCFIITCAAQNSTFVSNPVKSNLILTQEDQDLCDKVEVCTKKMVENFNYQELRNSPDIKDLSCNIIGFVCNNKEAVVGLRVHIEGTFQGQCTNVTILIEGGIHYNPETDKCDIKVKSTTYEHLEECGIEINFQTKNPS